MTADKVIFLTAEPFALSWVDEVQALVKKKVEIRLSSPRQVKHLLNEIFIVQKAFKGLSKDQGQRGSDKLRLLRAGKLDELDALIEKSKDRSISQDRGMKHEMRNGRQVEMRLSTLPCNFGEKLVVRIFDKNVASQDLSFIGFSDDDLKIWLDLITLPQGLVLVTGPTGSGKTTTLYTTLNKIATPDVNVCTAEDPIEMEIDNFNQVQVNPQIGLGFADCIRAFLRQDPDIIMVGEIRDHDTGEMAIQGSLTGHLVFSTLHEWCSRDHSALN